MGKMPRPYTPKYDPPLRDYLEALELIRKARLAGIDTNDSAAMGEWFRKHGYTFPVE